jgi:glutathionyl-hydroquinone reductase
MAYPGVDVSRIREEFPAIPVNLLSDQYVTNEINRAGNLTSEKLVYRCDLTTIKTLSTTPQAVIDIAFNITCALVLKKFFSEMKNARATDINTYLEFANEVIKELETGKRKIYDAINNIVYSFGMYYAGIQSNTSFGSQDRQDGRPYFGMGDLGQSLADNGDRSYYPMIYDKH